MFVIVLLNLWIACDFTDEKFNIGSGEVLIYS